MIDKKAECVSTTHFNLSPLQRFYIRLHFIITFMALFENFTVYIYNNVGVTIAFLETFITGNRILILVKNSVNTS
jgi:hypothetical protein